MSSIMWILKGKLVKNMKAMILQNITSLSENDRPLLEADLPIPVLNDKEILIKVKTCGVCHTELDEIEGRTPPPQFPVIPGHQVVGEVVETGKSCKVHRIGDRVGVGWIYSSCGVCEYCLSGIENLCQEFRATGRDTDGGYAEYMKVMEEFASSIPEIFTDAEAAPLLCAGTIGYRSLNLTGIKKGQKFGLTGFGGSGHLVLKLVKHLYPETDVYVFARSAAEREFAIELGAVWAGDTTERSPEKLHSIIDTTPAWLPVVEAMRNLRPGGRLVINAIRKEIRDREVLAGINYAEDLWMEREIKTVANVARSDISGFLKVAVEIPIKPKVQEYDLCDVNRALVELKQGNIRGAKVLRISR